jgi:AcrR family transcriptional regulator
MVAHSRTAEQILSTFLRLVAERGLDATTTRALAEEAGVNEVTVFRHFGDKATLAREAVRRFQPANRIAAYPLHRGSWRACAFCATACVSIPSCCNSASANTGTFLS